MTRLMVATVLLTASGADAATAKPAASNRNAARIQGAIAGRLRDLTTAPGSKLFGISKASIVNKQVKLLRKIPAVIPRGGDRGIQVPFSLEIGKLKIAGNYMTNSIMGPRLMLDRVTGR